MSSPVLPSASFPISPPLSKIQLVDPHTGVLTTLGNTFLLQMWAGLQGQGGAIPQLDTLNGMNGDATFDPATGELTVVSSEGHPFVASAFSDTTDADNITSGTLSPDRIGNGSLPLLKLEDIGALSLAGNPNVAAGPVVPIGLGMNLAILAGLLVSCGESSTVAGLPAPTRYLRRFVTDANGPTWLGAVAGGGSTLAPVFANGSGWFYG